MGAIRGYLQGVIDRAAQAVVARRLAGAVPARGTNGRAVHTQSADELVSILKGQTPGTLQKTLTDNEARQSYYRWQYAACTAIAEAVMMTDRYVEVQVGDSWERNDDHPLAALLRDANPWMTGEELVYWAVVECLMIGKTWWVISRNDLQEPAELWPVVGTMTPKLDDPDSPLITGWHQEVRDLKRGMRHHDYAPDEIVYLRLPRVGDVYGGFGPAQAAGAAIKLDQQIVESEWNAFKNGLFPFAILKMPAQTDAAKRDRVLDEFSEKYTGAQQTGRAIGMSDAVDIVWPQTKPREMGYQRGAEQVRDEILGAFRVPASILGLSKDVNRSSAQGMEYVFAKWRIAPLLRLLQARLNQDLALRCYGPGVRVRFASPVPADVEADRADDALDLGSFAMTVNERREKRGRDAAAWGDVPWGPISVVPIGSPPAGETQGAPGVVAGGELAAESSGASRRTQAPRGRSVEQRREVYRRFAADRVKADRKLRGVWSSLFRDLGRAVLKAWDRSGTQSRQAVCEYLEVPADVDRLLDPAKLAADMAKRSKPAMRWGLMVGGNFERGLFPDPSVPWDEGNAAIARYLAGYDDAYYHPIATETRRRYMAAVAAGVQDNETWAELRLRIVTEMGRMTEARAAAIATTETTKLYGAGGQAFRDEYEVGHKQWVCSFVNSRETHADADGQVVKNGDLFEVGGDRMMFPGDGSLASENCNCNCAAAGSLEKA